MARRRPKMTWQVALLLIAAVILWWIDFKEPPGTGAPRSGGYETIAGCRWESHRQNDGDSFRVRLPDGRVEQFRLYFVDAPESDFRNYGGNRTNHQRIREQALALGITDVRAVEIGKRAKSFVHDLLGRGVFTVSTRWDDPFGDRRYHAFVRPAGGPLLHELLVEQGLARIHTKPADLPDGTPAKSRLRELREIEEAARQAGRGAWGL